jgi:hypothetical protein
MIIGYNSKFYIKNFIEDLKAFAYNNNSIIEVSCEDSENDIYSVKDNKGEVFTIELWDITNYENNMYQELKIKYKSISKLLNLIIEFDKVKLMEKGNDYINFILIDDILSDVE